jgi:hypothetical protein
MKKTRYDEAKYKLQAEFMNTVLDKARSKLDVEK